MKIKSPLTHYKEVAPLCEAGANELFCGIEPYNWRRQCKDFCINQRSAGANFIKLSDLEKAIRTAHQYKTKVHVAMNAFFYLEEQYKLANNIIRDVLSIGADGIIFADAGLLSLMDEDLLRGKDIVVGCDAVIFNHQSVRFYKRFKATRIVLPRSMTVKEIGEVIQCDGSLEYEAFIIHDLCFFEDGFCTYCKEGTGSIKKEGRPRNKVQFLSASRAPMRGYGGGCRSRFRRQRIYFRNHRRINFTRLFTFWMRKHIQGCGACAIYDFKKMGISSLKVLDRNLPTEGKVKATVFIKESLGFLQNDKDIPRKEFILKCQALFKKAFRKKCNRYDCYYPSVFLR